MTDSLVRLLSGNGEKRNVSDVSDSPEGEEDESEEEQSEGDEQDDSEEEESGEEDSQESSGSEHDSHGTATEGSQEEDAAEESEQYETGEESVSEEEQGSGTEGSHDEDTGEESEQYETGEETDEMHDDDDDAELEETGSQDEATSGEYESQSGTGEEYDNQVPGEREGLSEGYACMPEGQGQGASQVQKAAMHDRGNEARAHFSSDEAAGLAAAGAAAAAPVVVGLEGDGWGASQKASATPPGGPHVLSARSKVRAGVTSLVASKRLSDKIRRKKMMLTDEVPDDIMEVKRPASCLGLHFVLLQLWCTCGHARLRF